MAFMRGLPCLSRCLLFNVRNEHRLSLSVSRNTRNLSINGHQHDQQGQPAPWSVSGKFLTRAKAVTAHRYYTVDVTPTHENVLKSPLTDVDIPVVPLGPWLMDKMKQHDDLVAQVRTQVQIRADPENVTR